MIEFYDCCMIRALNFFSRFNHSWTTQKSDLPLFFTLERDYYRHEQTYMCLCKSYMNFYPEGQNKASCDPQCPKRSMKSLPASEVQFRCQRPQRICVPR